MSCSCRVNGPYQELPPLDHVHGMLNDIFKDTLLDDDHVDKSSINNDASKFYGYMEYGNQEMYPDCKFTKLGVRLCLSHIKYLNKVTDKAFDTLHVLWER